MSASSPLGDSPEDAVPGGIAAPAKKRRRRWPRRVLIGVGILLLLGLGGGYALWQYINGIFNSVHTEAVGHLRKHTPKPGGPFNLLLVGSDSRAFVKSSQQRQSFGSGSVVTGQRSDVIIIAHVVPATLQVTLLSIPRDLWVNIPGHGVYSGWNRINASFNSGPSLLVQTIEDNLKIPIDHYAEVNFAGFARMVNALGGIYLDFRDPVYDQYSGLNIEKRGCQLINGAQALALVRSRHLYYYSGTGPPPPNPTYNWSYDGLSDFSRIRRQDAFFRAVINRAKSEVGLTSIGSLIDFFQAIAANLTVDTHFKGELRGLAFEFRNASTKDLHTEVLPTYGLTINGNEVLGEAQPYGSQMITRFLEAGSTPTGHHGTPSSHPGHGGATTTTTVPPTTTTSTPAGSVVFDTPTADPEPWNPVNCHT